MNILGSASSALDLPQMDQIIEGDCLEVLPRLPDESFDLVFADPPYNLQLSHELWRPNRTRVDAVKDSWDQFKTFTEYDEFTRRWLMECRRLLKPTGTIWVIGTYHNIHRIGSILQDLSFWILNDIVWIKTNPMPNFHGVRFTNAHETIIWAQKKRNARTSFNHMTSKALNEDMQMRSDWILPTCVGKERLKSGGRRIHPTQKPEALLYRILLTSTRPGDNVLDPFFGTGTTGLVAQRLKRRWLGIEKDPQYAKLAADRIQNDPFPEYPDEALSLVERRQRERIPFGRLLEQGLLHPGQELYFKGKGNIKAIVQSDGSLTYNQMRGTIHTLARQLLEAPGNGWDLWFFIDPQSGQERSINELRTIIADTLHHSFSSFSADS